MYKLLSTLVLSCFMISCGVATHSKENNRMPLASDQIRIHLPNIISGTVTAEIRRNNGGYMDLKQVFYQRLDSQPAYVDFVIPKKNDDIRYFRFSVTNLEYESPVNQAIVQGQVNNHLSAPYDYFMPSREIYITPLTTLAMASVDFSSNARKYLNYNRFFGLEDLNSTPPVYASDKNMAEDLNGSERYGLLIVGFLSMPAHFTQMFSVSELNVPNFDALSWTLFAENNILCDSTLDGYTCVNNITQDANILGDLHKLHYADYRIGWIRAIYNTLVSDQRFNLPLDQINEFSHSLMYENQLDFIDDYSNPNDFTIDPNSATMYLEGQDMFVTSGITSLVSNRLEPNVIFNSPYGFHFAWVEISSDTVNQIHHYQNYTVPGGYYIYIGDWFYEGTMEEFNSNQVTAVYHCVDIMGNHTARTVHYTVSQ